MTQITSLISNREDNKCNLVFNLLILSFYFQILFSNVKNQIKFKYFDLGHKNILY
jgi:hypothetical protein